MPVYYKTQKIADLGFVLNLPSRNDRKTEVTQTLYENHFTGWDFFDGQIIDDPEMKKFGCTMSQLNIFKYFLQTSHQTLLLLEDDVKLLRGLNDNHLDNIFDKWDEILNTYEVISLGTRFLPRSKITPLGDHHGQFSELLCAQAFVYHRHVVEHIVEKLENFNNPEHPLYKCAIDMFLNDISNEKYRFRHFDELQTFKFGVTIPMVFTQSEGYSDNEEQYTSYESSIEDSFWRALNVKKIDYLSSQFSFKKGYVFYCNVKYSPIVEKSIKSIRKYSTLPIFVYQIGFSFDYDYENVFTIDWNGSGNSINESAYQYHGDNFYLKRSEKEVYNLLIERPKVVKHCLENYCETVLYIDSDSIAMPWVENIFDYYNPYSDTPYFTEGVYDFLFINGRGGFTDYDLKKTLEHPLCNLLNVDQNLRGGYRQTGYFIAGQNTLNFLSEWSWICNHPKVLQNPEYFAPYHEETVVNVLLWKNKKFKGLPLSYVNGSVDTVNEVFNEVTFTGENQLLREWFKLPKKLKEIFFIHGEKNLNRMDIMIDRIEEEYSSMDQLKPKEKLKVLFLAPHLSTGGMPGFLLKRIESLIEHRDEIEVFVVEYLNLSDIYVVQKNRIKDLIAPDHFFTLEENKFELIDILRKNKIDIVHMDDLVETLDVYNGVPPKLMNQLYSNDRTWKIVETCHNVSFNSSNKIFHPEAYAFCTPWHPKYQFAGMPSYNDIIEFPIENKIVNEGEKKMVQIKLGLNPEKIHIVNVGLWTPGKNQGEGVEIARLLHETHPHIEFHFVGNQAGNFQHYWEPIMQNLPPNVRVWGERNDAEDFITACDIFMFNSTWECNPLVLREAISLGKKILARNLKEYLDMFTPYISIIDEDIHKTKETLLNLINAEVYHEISDNSFDLFGQQHIELYQKVYQSEVKMQESFLHDDVRFVQNFINQPLLEIKGNSGKEYDVKFFDEYDVCHYSQKIPSNSWIRLNRQYYTKWTTKIWDGENQIYEYTLTYEGKRVYIAFDSKSLGDNISWIPYVLEFKKKHNCHVIVSTFWNHLFKSVYPEIEFINPGDSAHNIHGMYKVGWFYDKNMEPELPNVIPLQKAATNILGLDYVEIKPKIALKIKENPYPTKYVTIATNSTAGLKFWTKEGWQEVINYLNGLGYMVVNVSKENNPFENAVQISDTSIENTMNVIHHSEFFIGLSSGLSWLAWGLGKKVVMISNFTEENHEFTIDCLRVVNKSVCNGCWNNPDFRFDRGDWNWCPLHKDTPRQFECHTTITSEKVIDKLNILINNQPIEQKPVFDWGPMTIREDGLFHKNVLTEEIFNNRIYESFFEVEEGDIVLDVGASVGPFTFSILEKKPKHVYCIEPSEVEFATLNRNFQGYPVTPILKGIYSENSRAENPHVYFSDGQMDGITFKKLCELYSIKRINFLKTDCEGGEYDIFNEENMEFIFNNVDKISGEWHLRHEPMKSKFRNFRDTYLKKFENVQVLSVDGVNITWNLWDESFLTKYGEILIFIDNRKK
jgi:autotransporter strand-loop-strand O-heptosyltransferase